MYRFRIARCRFYPVSYTKEQYLAPVRPVRCFVTPKCRYTCIGFVSNLVAHLCTFSRSASFFTYIHRVPEKNKHFNFRHNFAICWDIFTIFEAPCSGLIAGWRDLLHTHHRCEAFTWRDVTHDVIQRCCAQCALMRDFIPPDLSCLNPPDLNPADYSFCSIMQEKVYQTHIANIDELKHRLVQVWPLAGDGPQTYCGCYRTAAKPSQWLWRVCESSRGYFDQHLRWIYM